MAANTVPIFTDAPVCAVAQVTTANTARDGSGTPVTIYTPGADGGRISFVRIVATGTTTAGVIRLFIHDGSDARLHDEIIVPAVTPSTTVKVWAADWVPREPIPMPSTHSLRATTHITETFNVFVHGGNF